MIKYKTSFCFLMLFSSICMSQSSFWGGFGISGDKRAGGLLFSAHYIPSDSNIDFFLEFNSYSENFVDMDIGMPTGYENTYKYYAAMAGVGYFMNLFNSFYIDPSLLLGICKYDHYTTLDNKFEKQLPDNNSFVGQVKLPLSYSFTKYVSLTIFSSALYDHHHVDIYRNSGLELNIGIFNAIE